MKQSASKKSMVELALKWIWKYPEVSTVLSGMSEKQHVIDNIHYAEQEDKTDLLDADIGLIKEMKKVFRDKIKVTCTSCEYCLPCSVGVNIPKVFSYYNNYFLFDSDHHRKNVKSMYNSQLTDDEKASNCIDCGECEKKCPQNLPSRKELKKVKTLFED
jgi:predicted aldo/keto reductase-like oxidoreductase